MSGNKCRRGAGLEPRGSPYWGRNRFNERRHFRRKRYWQNNGRTIWGNQRRCEMNRTTQWAIRVILTGTRNTARLSRRSAYPEGFAGHMNVSKREKGLRQKYRQREQKKSLMSPKRLHGLLSWLCCIVNKV
jgi:hypothetical protein